MFGSVRHYASQQPVVGVHLRLLNPPTEVTTDASGNFALTSVPMGTVQIEPSFSLVPSSPVVTASDAVVILQYLVGMQPLDAAELLAADVNGSSEVTAADAALVLQYVVGAISAFPAAIHCGSPWVFVPVPEPVPNQQIIPPQPSANPCVAGAIAYAPLTQAAAGQNFAALLLGDVNGSWQASSALNRHISTAFHVRSAVLVRRGHRLVYRVSYEINPSQPFTAFEATVRYDPKLLRSVRARFRANNRSARLLAQHASEGRLRVAVASAQELAGPVTLWIEATGSSPSVPRRALRLESIHAE